MAVVGLALTLAALACVPGAASDTAPTATAPAAATEEPTEPEATLDFNPVDLPATVELPTRTPEPPKATAVPEATDTPEPEPTAAPEDTETPEPTAGEAIFSAGDACEWGVFALNFEVFEYTIDYVFEETDGQYYLEVPGENVAAYAVCEDFAEQGEVQIDVAASTVAGPNTNNVSLVCRYHDDGWYEGAITSGGYWYLYKFTEAAGYEQLATGGSLAINLKRATNQLSMLCVGETIALSVNGVELGSVSDDELLDGGFGISVSTFDIGGAGVLFDGLEVILAGE
jgi:hypothetical protein